MPLLRYKLFQNCIRRGRSLKGRLQTPTTNFENVKPKQRSKSLYNSRTKDLKEKSTLNQQFESSRMLNMNDKSRGREEGKIRNSFSKKFFKNIRFIK